MVLEKEKAIHNSNVNKMEEHNRPPPVSYTWNIVTSQHLVYTNFKIQ